MRPSRAAAAQTGLCTALCSAPVNSSGPGHRGRPAPSPPLPEAAHSAWVPSPHNAWNPFWQEAGRSKDSPYLFSVSQGSPAFIHGAELWKPFFFFYLFHLIYRRGMQSWSMLFGKKEVKKTCRASEKAGR